LSISSVRVPTLADGTTRYVSSANLTSEFPECIGLRSAAVTHELYCNGAIWMQRGSQ